MTNYKNIVPFIRKSEGGLSSDTKDRASQTPSPCGNGSNGQPYHTNKGIQWSTFKGLASKGGYSATCDNFLKMPDDVWYKVYKTGFWDEVQGDKIQNQAIANVFVEMTWGSGLGCSNFSSCKTGTIPFLNQFFKTNYNKDLKTINEFVDFVNKLDDEGKTPELFEKLNSFRAEKYKKMPTANAHLKGWLNRLNSFYILNKPYATSKSTKTTIGLGILLIVAGATLYYKYGRTK